MAYIQKIIPKTNYLWNDIVSIEQLRNKVFEYYKENILGKKIINSDRKYEILFTNKPGGRKISFGGSMYREKAEAIKFITDLLQYAKYNNWGNPKTTDKKYVIGYLNFKAKGIIGNKLCHFRIAVQLRKDGKLYYNHEINIIKK